MKLKKIALLLTAIVIAGCSKSSSSKESSQYNIGICQLVEHTALDLATKGFMEAMIETLGSEKVNFDLQVADGTAGKCKEIASAFAENKVDLMMANATTALQQCVATSDRITIVATSITDYGTALNIRKWNGITGLNVTGTSDLAPIEDQEKLIREVIPEVKTVGILYCSMESNSVYQATCMKSALEADGISCEIYAVKDESGIEAAIIAASNNCDALYVPTDNTMAAAVNKLKSLLTEYKLPMFAGEEGVCVAGVATLSIDYYNIGYKAGKMACRVLSEGEEAGLMEIEYSDVITKKYNPDMAKYFGIEIPENYVSIND